MQCILKSSVLFRAIKRLAWWSWTRHTAFLLPAALQNPPECSRYLFDVARLVSRDPSIEKRENRALFKAHAREILCVPFATRGAISREDRYTLRRSYARPFSAPLSLPTRCVTALTYAHTRALSHAYIHATLLQHAWK